MSVFRSKPTLRWLVPTAAAVVVIGGGAAAGTIVASAEPSLPERSAAQLLVDVQNAKVEGLSGTIVQTADLGLPSLAGLGGAGDQLTSLITGSNTARVWYGGENQVRLALVSKLGETDVIRNGSDVWLWQSQDNSASHFKLKDGKDGKRPAGVPSALPSGLPSSPKEAADAALAAIDPSTAVSTTGAAKVAGRDAYELVLSPRDTASLLGQVRIAIDAETHIPLGVNVYAKDTNNPALRIEFQQITFGKPDAEQFVFNPPPGTKVDEPTAEDLRKELDAESQKHGKPAGAVPARDSAEPTVIGTGWTSVVVAKMPAKGAKDDRAAAVQGLIDALPKVSGGWGSGHLLQSKLFTVLVTDDGRVLAGAVAPEKLYEAAGKK